MEINQSIEAAVENPPSKIGFVLVILYLIIDYGRPQDTIPLFRIIRPALCMAIILVFYLLRNFSLLKFPIPQIKLIGYFILILVLLIPFAVNHHAAFSTVLWFLLLMPFVLSCSITVNTVHRLKRILFVITCLMAYQAAFAIQHGGHGTGNTLWDENDLALFVCTWLPFCLSLFFSEKGIGKKIFFGCCIIIGLGSIVISFSRGGFLGLIGMFVVFWIFSPKKLLTLGILILGLVTVFIVSDLTSHGKITHQKKRSFWAEISTSTDAQNGTGRERVESWKAGWRMFLSNPIGVGGNNFQYRFVEYQSDWFKRGMWGRVAHSLWFTLISETGIEGIIVYFLLIFYNIKTVFAIRNRAQFVFPSDEIFIKNLSVAFLGSFAGFFGAATFLSVLYYPHFWYLTGIVIAVDSISRNEVATMDLESENGTLDNNT